MFQAGYGQTSFSGCFFVIGLVSKHGPDPVDEEKSGSEDEACDFPEEENDHAAEQRRKAGIPELDLENMPSSNAPKMMTLCRARFLLQLDAK